MAKKAQSVAQAQAPKTTPASPSLETWVKRFRTAESNQAPLFSRFSGWFDLFNAIINTRYAPWRSKVFLPLLTGRTWNLIAKLTAGKPGWNIRPRTYSEDPDAMAQLFESAEANEIKLDYDYENPEFDEPMPSKLAECLIDAAVTGTGIARIPYRTKNKSITQRATDKEGNIILGKEKVTTRRVGYNDLIPHSVFQTFVAPSAKGLQQSPWIILKHWVPKSELEQEIDSDGKPMYQNLDKLHGNSVASQDIDSAHYEKSRLRLTSTDSPEAGDSTIDNIEVLECHDKASNTITWIGNHTTILRVETNNYWHGKYPIVRFVIKDRPQSFWGYGLYEVNERMQLAANDLLNHYLDGLNLSQNGMLMYPSQTELEDYIVEPGGEIRYQGAEPPVPMKFPDPNANGMNIAMTMIKGGIEDNTISPYALGTPNSSADQTQGTKGGIIALQQAADDELAYMRTNFITSIHEIGSQWMMNNQQFMDTDVFVQITKHSTKEVAKITPESIQGEFDLVLDEKSMAPISKEAELQQYMEWLSQLTQLKQQAQADIMAGVQSTPIVVKYQALAQELSQKFGIMGMDRFLGSQQEAEKALQDMFQMIQYRIQHPVPQDRITVNYKDAPPSIQAQIEEKDGFQPAGDGERSNLDAAKSQQLQAQAAATTNDAASKIATHHLNAQDQAHNQAMDLLQASQPGPEAPAPGVAPQDQGPQAGMVPQEPQGNEDPALVNLLDPELVQKTIAHVRKKHGF